MRVLVALAALSITARAQDLRPDTTVTLGVVVVVAERAATPINRSSAAVTRLTAADLARIPNATVADVLRRVPGFAVVDFDGSGRDPQLMVRGFYGGGEAEYVVVMVDGRPVNLVHNGTIAWETLPPLSSIATIEIVRGSASSAHGDAAVAGAINIVTRQLVSPGLRLRVGAESHEGFNAAADLTRFTPRGEYTASIGFDRTRGFRDHASRTSGSVRGSLRLSPVIRTTGRLSLRDFEEPGPLLESLTGDGSESDPRFRDDGGKDTEADFAFHHDGVLGAGGTLNTTARLGGRRATLTRTLPLSPDFGDTRERELSTIAAGVSTQADLTQTILPPGFDRASAGLSVDLGTITSSYFSEQGGSRVRDARGNGWRGAAAGFLNVVLSPVERVRWTLGARVDYLHDSFDRDGGEGSSTNHYAFSPKLGVNVRYAANGNAWVAASRSFKTPTLDQLFDQRPVPVPFPPFSVTTSNPDLDPQRGTSGEAGLYHHFALGSIALGLTTTVYQLDMRNELDFDVQTLHYVNIARSRHRGAEVGLTFATGMLSGHTSLTLAGAESRSGANAGRQLKAVPGQTFAAGITATTRIGTASLSLTRMADMYIDDANTRRLPSWTRIDAQLSRAVSTFDVVVGARNLFDERFSSTGFLDPSGSGEAYFYPAAGRVITFGIRRGR